MKTAEYITKYKLKIKMQDIDRKEFFDTLEKIKDCNGRYYDNNNKFWIVPADEENKQKLLNAGFILPNDIIEQPTERKQKNIVLNDKIKNKLFPFQKIGVQHIENKNGKYLLGDEMGLGKTIQAISYISLHPEYKNIIVVCPASLKLNWQYEIKKWLNESSNILGMKYLTRKRIQIINYDIIKRYEKKLLNQNIDLIVLDECHYIKSAKAKRTVSTLRISKNAKHILALSGTPIINRPIEFWNVLNLICPEICNNYWYFIKRYCGAKQTRYGLDATGSSNSEELYKLLTENCMVRRTKSEVLQELPDKLKSIIYIQIDNRNEYDFASLDFTGWIQKTENKKITIEALAKIEKLKQLSVRGKMHSIIEWIQDFLEENDKLVIMATHHYTIDFIFDKFKDISVKLDGRDTLESKQKAVELFQTDKNIKLFIGNIKAAGTGITLTSASNLCFCEFGWSPGEMDQASDRIHRIGQKNACNIYYFVGKDTIDEDIIDLLDSKKQVIDSVLNGVQTEEESLLRTLLNKFKEI